ncbi:hypothetical protein [Roseovarius indicus]|uniref:hypothetical protein n=1 Tax=Roseovarius indicus TaxID=540747 RepID=UPI004059DCFF
MSAWAALVERLRVAGHSDPLEYTVGEAVAYDRLGQERRRQEMGDAYLIARNAAHGDEEHDKQFRASLGIGD